MTIEQIIAQLEARAEELAAEHGRIERALSELRPEYHAPAPKIVRRRHLSPEALRERVLTALQAEPNQSFTVEGLAKLADYDGKAVKRTVEALADEGLARPVASTAEGYAARFPRYQAAGAQLHSTELRGPAAREAA